MEWPEITKDTPVEEVVRIHRRIWDYVIEHGNKPSGLPYSSNCVFCEYALIYARIVNKCDNCPVDWPDGLVCGQDNSLYHKWCMEDEALAKIYATQIRDIKLKEEYLNGKSEDPSRSGEQLPE